MEHYRSQTKLNRASSILRICSAINPAMYPETVQVLEISSDADDCDGNDDDVDAENEMKLGIRAKLRTRLDMTWE